MSSWLNQSNLNRNTRKKCKYGVPFVSGVRMSRAEDIVCDRCGKKGAIYMISITYRGNQMESEEDWCKICLDDVTSSKTTGD